MIDIGGNYQSLLIALGTLGTVGGASTATAAYLKSKSASAQTEAEKRVAELRSGNAFQACVDITTAARKADWLILENYELRNNAGEILRQLNRAARLAPNRRAFRNALEPHESEAILIFLDAITPLIWVLRVTSLEMNGSTRAYEQKHLTGEEILNVMHYQLRRGKKK